MQTLKTRYLGHLPPLLPPHPRCQRSLVVPVEQLGSGSGAIASAGRVVHTIKCNFPVSSREAAGARHCDRALRISGPTDRPCASGPARPGPTRPEHGSDRITLVLILSVFVVRPPDRRHLYPENIR